MHVDSPAADSVCFAGPIFDEQELIRQMTQAAKVIGNVELQHKFEKTSEMLERPNSVIFTSSLYL